MKYIAPDGKEFPTKKELREYVMLNFYSFKNKVNEPEPLIKPPGSIDGQIFDISDCENSTLVVMDNSEQVQIDNVKKCKIFIAACESSIFIRNCEDCTFYTCSRQLRLRDVKNCSLYTYSMGEVHIEFSSGLKFGCFNGGYPEHADHLKKAKLDATHNLWYDVYDHNDAAKTHEHWALIPEDQYEEPWFPSGTPCEPAVPRTKPGSVPKQEEDVPPPPGSESSAMQSFSLEQLKQDALKLNISTTLEEAAASRMMAPPEKHVQPHLPHLVPPPVPEGLNAEAPQNATKEELFELPEDASERDKIEILINMYASFKAGDDINVSCLSFIH